MTAVKKCNHIYLRVCCPNNCFCGLACVQVNAHMKHVLVLCRETLTINLYGTVHPITVFIFQTCFLVPPCKRTFLALINCINKNVSFIYMIFYQWLLYTAVTFVEVINASNKIKLLKLQLLPIYSNALHRFIVPY